MRRSRKLLPLVVLVSLMGLAGGGVQTAGIASAQEGGGGMGFIKIAGIEGESRDVMHMGEIEIESWSWGETNQGTHAGGGGGGAGKVSMQDFHFTMKYSKASPMLFLACASGQHIPSAVLTLRKGGGDVQQEYLVVTLQEVLVTSYQTGGGSGEIPMDQVSLNFASIRFDYTRLNADGTAERTSAGWDLAKGKAI